MSRLDSFIRRVTAQRTILDFACAEVSDRPGLILELGLGNGRTFDHLREKLPPGRRIVAFDRALAAHTCSTPPDRDLVLGEIKDTAARFVGEPVAMVHADIGTGSDALDAITLTWLPQLTASLLQPGGLAVSGLPLAHPDLTALQLPRGISAGRYFLYRRK